MTKVRYRVFAMNFLAHLINYGDRIDDALCRSNIGFWL
jgi:hypothetical protein